MTAKTASLLDYVDVVISEITDMDELMRELDVCDRERRKAECGLAWMFSTQRPSSIYASAPTLALGVRGDVGALMWFDETRELVPAAGTNVEHVDYFVCGGHHFAMPPGAELPIAQAHAAVVEFVRTGQRPTCLQWAPTE